MRLVCTPVSKQVLPCTSTDSPTHQIDREKEGGERGRGEGALPRPAPLLPAIAWGRREGGLGR